MEKYDYYFPRISNQKYNEFIKVIAAHVGIEKNLISHVARHTFATYHVNKGVPIAAIQKAMGHVKITQTLEYTPNYQQGALKMKSCKLHRIIGLLVKNHIHNIRVV